jgi:hypothetical protein
VITHLVHEKISILVEIALRSSHRNGTTYWDLESYVDNIIMAYLATKSGETMRKDFMTSYKKRFNTEERGTPSKFMGIKLAAIVQTKLSPCHKSNTLPMPALNF